MSKNLIANRKDPWGAFVSNLSQKMPIKKGKDIQDSRINDFIVRNSMPDVAARPDVLKVERMPLHGIKCHEDEYDFDWPIRSDQNHFT